MKTFQLYFQRHVNLPDPPGRDLFTLPSVPSSTLETMDPSNMPVTPKWGNENVAGPGVWITLGVFIVSGLVVVAMYMLAHYVGLGLFSERCACVRRRRRNGAQGSGEGQNPGDNLEEDDPHAAMTNYLKVFISHTSEL